MRRSDSIKEIATALAKAQGEIEPAKKDSTNPHFKSKYADLASVVAACREPLARHGLSIVQEPSLANQVVTTTSLLMHTSGEWIECSTAIPVSRNDAPSIGSATTYGRRYGYSALVGVVADEDDDGAGLTGDNPPKQKEDAPKTQPRAERVTAEEIAALAERWKKLNPQGELTNDQWRTAWEDCCRRNGGPRVLKDAGSWNREHVRAVDAFLKLQNG